MASSRTERKRGLAAAVLEEYDEDEGEAMDDEEEGDDGFADECERCKGGGEVVCCDYCPKAYHLKCVNLKYPPDGISKFSCPDCGDDICDVCKSSKRKNVIVHCRYCLRRYHPHCLPRVPAPEDLWLCPACESDATIDKILAWRPVLKLGQAEVARRVEAWAKEAQHGGSRGGSGGKSGGGGSNSSVTGSGRKGEQSMSLTDLATDIQEMEYHIRWQGKAYWHCSWVPETFLVENAKMKLKNFKARQAESEIHIEDDSPEEDEEGAINPSWLQVDRVLDERKTRSLDGRTKITEYFVKWTGLEYDESTWELKSDLIRHGFEPMIKHYLRRDQDWALVLQGDLGLPSSYRSRFHPLTKQPSCFHGGTWHDYQLEGINFLRNAWWAPNHVILADEMGLGKTIQTIGYLRCIAVENKAKFRPSLVVCPLAVVDNWEREIKTWCPEMDAVVYKGSQASRDLLQRYEARGGSSSSRATTATTTKTRKKTKTAPSSSRPRRGAAAADGSSTEEEAEEDGNDEEEEGEGEDDYVQDVKGEEEAAGLKRKRSENVGGKHNLDLRFHVLITSFEFASRDSSFFTKIDWQSVVVDEGHRLKGGAQGKLYKTLQDFRAKHRVLLTGTPLQNSLEELFNLLHFLDPAKFANIEDFKSQFASMDKEAQLSGLRDLIAPHMLRRLKKDVNLCIPEKHELLVRVELSEVQKSYYRLILTKNFEVLRKKFKAASSIYNMIMQLKKVCNHPFLMQDDDEDGGDSTDLAARGESLINVSGKLKLLDAMLQRLKREGHRVLLFSQMTSMLDILEEYLNYRKWRYQRIDGSTKATDRQARIDAFNREALDQQQQAPEDFIFLLSTRAGGLGINLTSADTVIIYDMDWNPHNDLQALARAHRIGQTKKVMVYRFVARNTVEERILQLAKKKLLLEHVVVGEAGRGRNMTQNELDDVLKYGTEELFEQGEEAEEGGEGDEEGDGKEAEDNEESIEAQGKSNAKKWGDGNSSKKKKGGAPRMVIHWDDDAVERLLDRNVSMAAAEGGEGQAVGGAEEAGGGKGSSLSELFNSFRVARFTSVEEEKGEQEEEDEDERGREGKGSSSRRKGKRKKRGEASDDEEDEEDEEGDVIMPEGSKKSWAELLGKRYESMQMEEAAKMGKGKREKREVQRHIMMDSPGADSSSRFTGDYMSSDGEDEGPRGPIVRGKGRADLLLDRDRMGRLTVYGMGETQRRAIRAFIMSFGLVGGDWDAFYAKLMENCQKRIGDRSLQDVRRYVTLVLQHAQELVANPDIKEFEGGVPREQLDAGMLKRVALVEMIHDKVDRYEGRHPTDFVINEGELTGWSKPMSFSCSKGFSMRWTRDYDLTLLRLTVKYGYANWRFFLTDADFVRILSQAITFDEAPQQQQPQQQQQQPSRGGEGGGGGGATVMEEDDDEEGDKGAASGGGGGGGGVGVSGLTEPQSKALLGMVVKRMKVVTHALMVERQRLRQQGDKAVAVKEHVDQLAVREEGVEVMPVGLERLQEERDALKTRLDDIFNRLNAEARVEEKRRLLELVDRRDDQQALVADLLGRLTKLANTISSARGLLVLGAMANPRIEALLKDMDAVKNQLKQALESAAQQSDAVEEAIKALYGDGSPAGEAQRR